MLSKEEGKQLVELAREAIKTKLENVSLNLDNDVKDKFSENQGCFVSLYLNNKLRGCIGIPEPVMPLWRAVVEGAKGAAFKDFRFTGITEEEFEDIKIEVSVLTVPTAIEVDSPEECINSICIGQDGLMIKKGDCSGLLLPQVAPEQGWSPQQFLQGVCLKAGLQKDAWQEGKLYKFQAQIFSENQKGEIIEKTHQ